MGGLQGTMVWTGHFLRDLAKREICIICIIFFDWNRPFLISRSLDYRIHQEMPVARVYVCVCVCA